MSTKSPLDINDIFHKNVFKNIEKIGLFTLNLAKSAPKNHLQSRFSSELTSTEEMRHYIGNFFGPKIKLACHVTHYIKICDSY